MSLIQLTPNQERFIQEKLKAGKYHSAEEVVEIALQLLDEYEQAESAWAREVRAKVEAAIEASEQTHLVDGETFVNGILERFQQAKSS
jgi:antitoxin ParD1/3/4